MTAPALEVRGLCRRFGGLTVADRIDLTLAEGERVALIGPNGAGKTTFVNLVTGMLAPTAGAVRLAGSDVTREPPERRARLGLVRTFQVSRLFPALSVEEHLLLALLAREDRGGRMLAAADADPALRAEATALAGWLGLGGAEHRPAGSLAYGQQRLLDLALALALRPRVLLLDEPAAGVPSHEASRVLAALDALPAGLAVLMIDHDMDLVFRFARRVVVLVGGRVIADGPPGVVSALPAVREAYLGSFATPAEATGGRG